MSTMPRTNQDSKMAVPTIRKKTHSRFYRVDMTRQVFTCLCGVSFPTNSDYDNHEGNCDYAKIAGWERSLMTMTTPGSECFPCGRLLSLDDILFRDQMLIFRPYYDSFICSKCRNTFCPYEGEPQMQPADVDKYLCLRRTTAPYPWLQERRAQLFRELQEYLHHPIRIQKWLESGRDLESYLV
ncbi:DnaJ sub B member 9 [Phytophthora boehmeriae]|uniref:DnaJ sub B member 9 n=1 Tax=Phytophthora boehmeriae TaxID=109152 RepID=A0A8T1X505_9STRA|nr:DnaJ sub B member 9 [Phytophthora boehmeriae]